MEVFYILAGALFALLAFFSLNRLYQLSSDVDLLFENAQTLAGPVVPELKFKLSSLQKFWDFLRLIAEGKDKKTPNKELSLTQAVIQLSDRKDFPAIELEKLLSSLHPEIIATSLIVRDETTGELVTLSDAKLFEPVLQMFENAICNGQWGYVDRSFADVGTSLLVPLQGPNGIEGGVWIGFRREPAEDKMALLEALAAYASAAFFAARQEEIKSRGRKASVARSLRRIESQLSFEPSGFAAREFALNLAVEPLFQEFRSLAAAKGITLCSALCPDTEVRYDKERLVQTLGQILLNSISRTERGIVSLSFDEHQEEIVINITDTGVRSENILTEVGGASLAYRQNTPCGSVYSLSVPIKKQSPIKLSFRPKLLIADSTTAHIFRRYLRHHCGEITVCATAQEATKALVESKYDLLIADAQFADGSVLDIVESGELECPIIICTNAGNALKDFSSPNISIVEKPVDESTLLLEMLSLLQGRERQPVAARV